MSNFTPLNLLGFNSEQDMVVKIIKHQDVCLCCLAKNVEFVNLATCKHTSFFEIFFQFKFQYQNSVVCKHCHNFLNKIDLFKAQIEECLGILWSEQEPLAVPKKFQNLVCSGTQHTTNVDVKTEPIVELNESPDTNSDNVQYDLTTEVKVENDSSDFETDMPLSEVKKEIKKVKKKKSKKAKVSSRKSSNMKLTKKSSNGKLNEKYEGKLTIVTIDREELMLERESEAQKESYLRLPYKCENCITGFDHEMILKEHMEKRHVQKNGSFVCDICKSVLSTVTSYKEHTKRHTRRYECLECGKRFSSVYTAVKHYTDHHGTIDISHTCQDCGFTTDSHRRYRYHRDKHKQKSVCTICGKTFVSPAGLKVHMFTVHKHSSRVYSCATCGKVYNAKSGLAAHAASAHARASTAYCVTCMTHFRSEQGLAHHLRTHSAHITDADKKFRCDDCGLNFVTNVSLREHIDFVHLKITKYECGKCSKVFKNNASLKRHDDFVHLKLRPPRNKICDHCGRGFTSLSILQSHIRTHTGERPLRCPRCPATFSHSAALYTHNKLLHNGAKMKN